MAIFILVFTLLVAFLAIALLLGIAPISSKAKYRTMYVGATLMILIALMTCDYIDMQTDMTSRIRFHAVLVFAIAVGYFCIAVAHTEKVQHSETQESKIKKKPLRQKSRKRYLFYWNIKMRSKKPFYKGNLNGWPGK